ncbi:MarR family winged helix-turn-helix transcriptional regulator [Paenibacillus chitinolyticus]|uniref:MarR family winged helix-turn-helix transcriptional regulator n=1 Tax=Paenibacillus chitinolyticus TaxID=79263 RepID=UPI001C495ADF|nr:MarR family winged helix-turn-helix transcriptional regulator [Paenibacillus chitinolyticus]MBV6717308.1 MarR family transcriptional regulator [Paenibacillus chitinolyticus]
MHEKEWALYEEADWLFRRLVRKFVKERDKISVKGITLPGMLILNSINREGEQRMGELAEQLDFTSGAVTALCDKLEAGGFAVRIRSESDRRSVALDITDKGRELLRRNSGLSGHMIDILFGGFSPEELEHQIVFSRRLLERLEGFAEAVAAYPGEDAEGVDETEADDPAIGVPSSLAAAEADTSQVSLLQLSAQQTAIAVSAGSPVKSARGVASGSEPETDRLSDKPELGNDSPSPTPDPFSELLPESSSQPSADQLPAPKPKAAARKKNFISY